MADSIRPRLGGKTSNSAVYQIARPRFDNGSDSSSVLSSISYPLFFIGTVVVAGVLFLIRKHDLAVGTTSPALILTTTPASDTANVVNLTNEINMEVSKTYTPYGSANPNPI
jgi:hypothetical protein